MTHYKWNVNVGTIYHKTANLATTHTQISYYTNFLFLVH